MDMERKKLEKKLQERIEANYRTYLQQLQSRPASDLIEQATEIAAVKLVYDELMGGCNPDYADYLLRFDNPLQLVSDQWLAEQNVSHADEMDNVLWSITDKGLGEGTMPCWRTGRPPRRTRGYAYAEAPPFPARRGVCRCGGAGAVCHAGSCCCYQRHAGIHNEKQAGHLRLRAVPGSGNSRARRHGNTTLRRRC